MKRIKSVAIVVMLAGASGMAGAYLFNKNFSTESGTEIKTQPVAQPVRYAPTGAAVDFTEAAEHTVHAVVHVKTFYPQQSGYRQNNMWDPFGFFSNPYYRNGQKPASTGSGVIISDDGYIVTNNHVVENAERVEITLNDNSKFEAKVIATDPSTDLALVKVEAKKLPYVLFGNSDEVKVGQWVLAVGNPFDLSSTVTAGIISAKGRNINIIENSSQPIESFLQTDAAINPGNSGGALVNTNGELIGINTAIASNTGSYAGYGFAVPVNLVKKVVDDFIEFGAVQRAFIGISIKEVNAELAKDKGLKETQGVYIDKLTSTSGAKAAGLREGDVITKINGIKINSFPELTEQVGRYRPGDQIKVTYLRENETKEANVTLTNKAGSTNIVKNEISKLLGAEFTEASTEEKNRLGIDNGVKILALASGKLKSAGIKEGFIITSIDNRAIKTIEDVEEALNDKKGGVLIEGVYVNGMRAWYGLGL